jgi:hypothetical protein
MQETELTSGDFSREYVIEKGKIVRAAGLGLVAFGGKVSNPLLAVNASNVRSCVSFASGGIQVGMAKDAQIYVDIRADLNRAKQVQAVLMMGAVRKEGARVQKVTTTRTP